MKINIKDISIGMLLMICLITTLGGRSSRNGTFDYLKVKTLEVEGLSKMGSVLSTVVITDQLSIVDTQRSRRKIAIGQKIDKSDVIAGLYYDSNGAVLFLAGVKGGEWGIMFPENGIPSSKQINP